MDTNEYSRALLEGFLNCPGCQNPYNSTEHTPKLLSCGHTYCDYCVTYLAQSYGGKVRCPEDGQEDFRDLEDIAESHHYKDLIEKVMVCCNFNFNHPGEFFSPSSMICVCTQCKPSSQYQDWVPTRGQDFGGHYGHNSLVLLSDEGFKARVFQSNPNIQDRMKRLHLLAAREKQLLYFSLLSVHYGQECTIPMPGPPPGKVLDENGWVELNRFHNIIPEKYCQNLTEVRRWTISQQHNQVEAVTLKPDKRVELTAIALCKECGDFTGGCIQSLIVVDGNETIGASMTTLASNVRYTARNKQYEKIIFAQPFVMNALREYTFKVKYVGRFLYFGNPARRVDPLKGPDGVTFKVTDPAFKQPEHQSGQGSLTGPLVKFFYKPTGPIRRI